MKIFYFFPETDDQILSDSTKEIVKNVFLIDEILKKKGDYKIYYDSDNINTFFTLNEITGSYLERDTARLRILLNKSFSVNIHTSYIYDTSIYYLQWNLDSFSVCYSSNIIKEITEHISLNKNDNILLLNFNNSIQACRDKILIFRDSKHKNDFPENFIHINYVADFLEFQIWLNTVNKSGFSLLNKSRFVRTSLVRQGKAVFQEIETYYYWYLDNFHKNEYEVFNHNKEHIGVSNLDGIIDFEKVVVGRKL